MSTGNFDQEWDELMVFERGQIEARPEHWFYMVRYLYKWQYKQWFLSLLTYFGDVEMARGKTKTEQTKLPQSAGQFTQFVNYTLPETHGDALAAYMGKADKVYADWTSLLRAGYRVGFSYDSRTDAIICSLTARDEGDPNFGKTMTSFAGDWYTALAVAMYKHYTALNEDWTSVSSPTHRPAFG